jgi:Predicted Zn-dependent protease
MVPVLTFTNSWISWVLLAGLFLYQVFPSLLWIGIGLFALTTLFSFITSRWRSTPAPAPSSGWTTPASSAMRPSRCAGRPQMGRLHLCHRGDRLAGHPSLLHFRSQKKIMEGI